MVRAPRSHPGSSCRTARLLFPSGRRRATLREQVALLKRKRPRPVLNPLDRFFLGCPPPLLVPLGRCRSPRRVPPLLTPRRYVLLAIWIVILVIGAFFCLAP